MSDTPRTDAAEAYQMSVMEGFVSADLTRQLERELAEAIAQRDAAFRMTNCQCGTDEACLNLARLHRELSATRAERDDANSECGYRSKERDEARAEAQALRECLTQAVAWMDGERTPINALVHARALLDQTRKAK